MKLDVNVLRYLSKDDFRVLTSVEMGQKNHEIVPMPLIDTISGLKHGGAFKCVKTLLRHKLLHHDGSKYDGYRLTNMGYDFLAIKALCNRGHISGVGRQIGVGKESDIFEVTNDEGEMFALKLHRLGRTSFRAVKSKRDYLQGRNNFSWLYLSRLAALKEYAFMKALGEHGFPVPQAIDHNRHAVLMTLLDSFPLVQVKKLQNPAQVYLTCMELISRLASKGLIHCDFNEFNLLINDDEELTIIDFPQMVSVGHANARELYDRDVECIIRFFSKKIGYVPEHDKSLPYVRPNFDSAVAEIDEALDVDLAASGFQRQHQKVLEDFAATHQEASEDGEEGEDGEGEQEEGEGEGGEPGCEDSLGPGPGTVEQSAAVEEPEETSGSQREGQAPGPGPSGSGEEEGGSGPDEDGDDEEEEEEEEEEGEEGDDGTSVTFGGRRIPKQAGRARGTASGLGEKQVQQVVTAQRKKQQRRDVMAKAVASRNSSKVKGKGGKASGSASATASFGGW